MSDTIHADTLALFALNINILPAQQSAPQAQKVEYFCFDMICDVIKHVFEIYYEARIIMRNQSLTNIGTKLGKPNNRRPFRAWRIFR